MKRLEPLAGDDAMRSEAQAGLDPCAEMRYALDMIRPYDNLLMTEESDGNDVRLARSRFMGMA